MSTIISANKAASPAFASTHAKQPPASGIRLTQAAPAVSKGNGCTLPPKKAAG